MENIDFLKVMLFSHGYDLDANVTENNGLYAVNAENRFFDGRIDFVDFSFVESVRMIQSQMFWDHDKLDNLSRYFRFFENQRDILIGWKREALFKYAEIWWTFFDMNIPIVTDGYWEKVKDYYKDKIKDIADYLYGYKFVFWFDEKVLTKIEKSTNGILITYTDCGKEMSINVNALNGLDDNPYSIRKWFRLLLEAGFNRNLFPPSVYVGKYKSLIS